MNRRNLSPQLKLTCKKIHRLHQKFRNKIKKSNAQSEAEYEFSRGGRSTKSTKNVVETRCINKKHSLNPAVNKTLKTSYSTHNLRIETGNRNSNYGSFSKNMKLRQADRTIMKKVTARNTINLVNQYLDSRLFIYFV